MPRRDSQLDCKIYVGDLPRDASEKEIERAFAYYGPLKNVWVARNPPGFAFVEYQDPRDADDAVRGLDGTTICGGRVRVEHSSGKVRPKPWMRRGPPNRGSRRPYSSDDRCYECGERGHYASDCHKGGGGRRRRSRSRSRDDRRGSYSRRRSYSRSRSRSRSPVKKRVSKSISRSRSRSRSVGVRNNGDAD